MAFMLSQLPFGLKLALWVEEMRRNSQRLEDAKRIISVVKISGAVGTYATVSPEVEKIACQKLGLTPCSNLKSDSPARPPCSICRYLSYNRRFIGEIRHRNQKPSKD